MSRNVPDNPNLHCNLRKETSKEVIKTEEEVRRKDTEGVNGRAEHKKVSRGTRLLSDALLSEADRQWAIAHGVTDPDRVWAEFIDFWIAIPGTRGTKLNWSATWRNRVRQVATRQGSSGRPLNEHEKRAKYMRQGGIV